MDLTNCLPTKREQGRQWRGLDQVRSPGEHRIDPRNVVCQWDMTETGEVLHLTRARNYWRWIQNVLKMNQPSPVSRVEASLQCIKVDHILYPSPLYYIKEVKGAWKRPELLVGCQNRPEEYNPYAVAHCSWQVSHHLTLQTLHNRQNANILEITSHTIGCVHFEEFNNIMTETHLF